MKRCVIGLVGFKGSGKDTVAQILVNQHGFQQTSFAAALKDAVSAMFGWERHLLEGSSKESRAWRETPDTWWSHKLGRAVSPRYVLQHIGTEIVRKHFNSKFWVLRTERFVDHTPGSIVVSDARFLDEIAMIRQKGGVVIHVRRGEDPSYWNQALWFNKRCKLLKAVLKPFMTRIKDIHESEREWIGVHFDYVIENNGSLEDLDNAVSEIIHKLEHHIPVS